MNVLAFDLGASSGRGVIGSFDGERLTMEEVHRFRNEPVRLGTRMHWDILRIIQEIKTGIVKGAREHSLQRMAVNSWAVDFALFDENGELLANPYHYRDTHTDGMLEKVEQIVPREELFRRTGIQFMPINTLYQLMAIQEKRNYLLEKADALLMIPDVIRYYLTGEQISEHTNASTTQLWNVEQHDWDRDLLQRLQLPTDMFQQAVAPGTDAGSLSAIVREELQVPALAVTTVAEHDTGSAVVAVPSTAEDFAYLSCGTWSLLGTEVARPALGKQALEWNFTNEGGAEGTYRLLKNIMGLWILQECMRIWEQEGDPLSFDEMPTLVEQAEPFRTLIDPDDDSFLSPLHMPQAIRDYCNRTNQPEPQSKGAFVRCILESLALKYRLILERTEGLAGKTFPGLHMIGGGIQNTLLCQFTANALARPVWAGPIEATAIGNVLVQYIAAGKIANIREGRQVVAQSSHIRPYEPHQTNVWQAAYERFTTEIVV